MQASFPVSVFLLSHLHQLILHIYGESADTRLENVTGEPTNKSILPPTD